MSRSLIGWIAAAIFAVVLGAFAWVFFAGGSGEPSTELTTPTIAAEPTTTAASPDTTEAAAPDTTQPESQSLAFVIDPEQSEASFEIDEELRGTPTRVVGTTSEVAGQVAADPGDLSTAQFSQMIINARTLRTDSSFRDRAIRGPIILDAASDEFEFITFDVTGHDASGSLSPGDSVEFSITGELTVKGTTNEETFTVTVTMDDESAISGTAETTIMRADYGIGIPSAPGVANVGEEVLIRLDFVALAETS